ncbi:MAG: CvpA family protein [Parcubacteria group bacterium]|nr:CvpA family protein [Parcubacteria group bacterium]
MGFIDIILLVIVGAFILFGLFFGLIHTLGSLIGAVIGIAIASRFVEPAAETFSFLVGDGSGGKVIVFIILFLLVSRLVGLVFWILEKVFGFVSIVPFAKSINRLLGGIFGFIEGVIVVGVILFYAMQVLPEDTLLTLIEGSSVANYLVAAVSALQVLFPESLRIVSE